MILDKGILSVFRREELALSGEMPKPRYTPIFMGWYGEISFETSPARPTEGREELRTDARVRILQDRRIKQDDLVVLAETEDFLGRGDAPAYRITRAYHGPDETGVTQITDLSLEVYVP